VRKYLPDFKVRDEGVSRDVTVWNLLTHTAGWEGQVSGPERGEDTLRNFTATVMPDLMQVAPPSAAWSYNNAGFSVSGRVIEAVTGMSINRAIDSLVFQPLGLKTAGTTAGDFIVNRFASGHANRGDNPPTVQRPFSPSVSVTAGGWAADCPGCTAVSAATARRHAALTSSSPSLLRYEPAKQERHRSSPPEPRAPWRFNRVATTRYRAACIAVSSFNQEDRGGLVTTL